MTASPNSPRLINDRYEVISLLGKGQAGEVFRVLDVHLKQEVALKLLEPKKGQPATWYEAQVLTLLQSEYLLPVYNADVVAGGDIRYITSPLMLGGDLEGYSKPHGLDSHSAVYWGQQIAHALERIHAASLVHRDVKPSNVFLKETGDIALGDLGEAVHLDADGTAPPSGSWITAAPEAIGHPRRCSVSSDIYSLGATVYYLLGGEYPVANSNDTHAMIGKIVAGDVVQLRDIAPHVSAGVARVVHQALALDPTGRPASALEFANRLAAATNYQRKWSRVTSHTGSGHIFCVSGQMPDGRKAAIGICVVGLQRNRVEIQVAQGARRMRRHEVKELAARECMPKLRAMIARLD